MWLSEDEERTQGMYGLNDVVKTETERKEAAWKEVLGTRDEAA